MRRGALSERYGARVEGPALRAATVADSGAIHHLIAENVDAGHLLPRSISEIEEHASRFVVAEMDGRVVGCAELAPLSGAVAEVRSLVVDEAFRGQRIGGQLVASVAAAGAAGGFSTLCAFTHEPRHFLRLGFSVVPHSQVPEKIARDCTGCALFRRCGQYAVTLALRPGAVVQPLRATKSAKILPLAARRTRAGSGKPPRNPARA